MPSRRSSSWSALTLTLVPLLGACLSGTLRVNHAGSSTGPSAAASAGGASAASTSSGGGLASASGGSTGRQPTAGTGAGSSGTSLEGGSGGGSGSASGGTGTGVPAQAARAFLDSLGVCAHLAQGVDSAAPVATALNYLGIRELRDDGNPNAVPAWLTVHQLTGARICMLPNSDLTTTLGMAEALVDAGALLAVEGPNEPNNAPVTYQGQTSSFQTTFLPVANFQRDLYRAVTGDPLLRGVPVFASSEAGGSEPDDVGLQFLTIPADAGTSLPAGTVYADDANTHNYVCGHSSLLGDNVSWHATDPTLNADWDGPYVEYGHTWHKGFGGYSDSALETLPKVCTETGWLTSGPGAITQEQQARVFLNLYLDGFTRGWSYTFIYMLRDDPVQGLWGLVDTSYAPKTSGTYLHNLTTILADPGRATPGSLSYAIAAPPATVHQLLLQKSTGSFELAVWDEHQDGGSDQIEVTFGSPQATVVIYDPTTGTAPLQTLSDQSAVPLTLTDHPVILELPAGG